MKRVLSSPVAISHKRISRIEQGVIERLGYLQPTDAMVFPSGLKTNAPVVPPTLRDWRCSPDVSSHRSICWLTEVAMRVSSGLKAAICTSLVPEGRGKVRRDFPV